METVPRHIQPKIADALQWSRVVMLHGARQSGKSTLAQIIARERNGTYVSLEDDNLRNNILTDPVAFLSNQTYPLVIDEAQRGGDPIITAIKRLVDEEQTPGRFLLTGSTNFLTVPTISESLAGRIQIFQLCPLSEAELAGSRSSEITSWFEDGPALSPATEIERADYFTQACRGGYPEVINLNPSQRQSWFASYIETVVQRDIAALADIRKTASLPRLMHWAAAHTSGQINQSEAANDLKVSRQVINAYLEWLRTVFLLHELPAWSRNLSSRTTRQPKFHITDSGLAASLLGVDADALASPTAPAAGPLLETFAVNEIARQVSASCRDCKLYHWRNHQNRQYTRREIDLILEARDGRVVAVEIKASSSPSHDAVAHLSWLRDKLDSTTPGAFRAGIVLHTGPYSFTAGDRLYLRPINCLWSHP